MGIRLPRMDLKLERELAQCSEWSSQTGELLEFDYDRQNAEAASRSVPTGPRRDIVIDSWSDVDSKFYRRSDCDDDDDAEPAQPMSIAALALAARGLGGMSTLAVGAARFQGTIVWFTAKTFALVFALVLRTAIQKSTLLFAVFMKEVMRVFEDKQFKAKIVSNINTAINPPFINEDTEERLFTAIYEVIVNTTKALLILASELA